MHFHKEMWFVALIFNTAMAFLNFKFLKAIDYGRTDLEEGAKPPALFLVIAAFMFNAISMFAFVLFIILVMVGLGVQPPP